MNVDKPVQERIPALTRLAKKTGRFYILVIVAIAQLPFFPSALIGAFIIQTNAALTFDQLYSSALATFSTIFCGYVAILIYIFFITRKASERLEIWAKTGQLDSDTEDEHRAWQEMASLSWRYGIVSLFIIMFIDVAPVVAFQYYVLKISPDQVIYSLFGGLVPAVSVVVLAILLLDNLLIPAREILLPKRFENQLKGSSNSYILVKFMFIGVALIIIAALIIAPIGYHQTTRAISGTINPSDVLIDLRVQLIYASLLAILISFGITLMLSRSFTYPIDSLIQTFIKVEKGDLSQRAKVLATDEIGELAIYFNHMIVRLDTLQQSLEKRVGERSEQLRVSTEVGRIASTILDPDTVIARVVELITQSFDYYYAAIFLVSENGRWAELKDATGSAGAILKTRHHRLQISNTSMVGAAITSHEAQVALDVGDAPVRFVNPLLPNTRSEIAIPLLMGDRVIGALDVQSTRGADFRQDDISTLQSMANQVAIAIENARLFKEMELALDELRQANRQNIVSAWSEKLKTGSLEHTTHSAFSLPDAETKEVAVRLNLRDENIGHILLETEGEWSQEDQVWVEAIATQVAISLENARLIEESQQSALRERLAASIIQKIWAANSIDGILQTAVRELGRALEVSEATIELKVEE